MKRRSEHLVRKRDGRTEFLRATKLARSIHQAMRSVGIDEDWRAIELANVVLTALQQRAEGENAARPAANVAAGMLSTDAIADAVQHVLVATGQAHAAVAYGAVAAERSRRHRSFASLGLPAASRSAAAADEIVAANRASALVRSNRFGQE